MNGGEAFAMDEAVAAIFEHLPAVVLLGAARDLAAGQLACGPWADDEAVRDALARWDDEDAVARWARLAERTGDPAVRDVAALRRALRHSGRERVVLAFLAPLFGAEAPAVFALAAQPHLAAWWDATTHAGLMEQLYCRLEQRALVRELCDRAQRLLGDASKPSSHESRRALALARGWLDGATSTAQCATTFWAIRRNGAPAIGRRAELSADQRACFGALGSAGGIFYGAFRSLVRESDAVDCDDIRARFACPVLEALVAAAAVGSAREGRPRE